MDRHRSVIIRWAVVIAGAILTLDYYWFAVADRYAVFLYEHLGATPFDDVTSSRYWMTGLVAGGVVLMFYVSSNFLIGYWARHQGLHYQAQEWYMVWLYAAPFVAAGISIITMNVNQPTLPFSLALACTAVTLIGMALALLPGSYAAREPTQLAWLTFDGLGLLPPLMTLHSLEVPARGILTYPTVWLINIASVVIALGWYFVIGRLRSRYRHSTPLLHERLIAGLCWSYLLMPLAHHILATPPPYRYITTAGNFFAATPLLQLAIWSFVALLAWGSLRLENRHRYSARTDR